MAEDALSGLETDARAGIWFDSGAASTMAQQCADMTNVMSRTAWVMRKAKALSPLNERNSGAKLAAAFTDASTSLVTVLTSHMSVLTEIGESFVAAGKLFDHTDDDSARRFTEKQLSDTYRGLRSGKGQHGLAVVDDSIEPTDLQGQPGLAVPANPVQMPTWGASGWSGPNDGYAWSGTAKTDYDNLLAGTQEQTSLANMVGKNGTTAGGVAIAPEPGVQYEWDDFHNHWHYVNTDAVLTQLADLAQKWHTARTDLNSQLDTFRAATGKNLQEYQGGAADAGVWASSSAQRAKTAVNKYLDNVATLTSSMEIMSTNLAFAHGWLGKLQTFLPHNSISDTYDAALGNGQHLSQASVDQAMKDLRRAWDDWYGEGVKDSSGAIPALPDPKSTIQGQPSTGQPSPGTQKPGDQQQSPGSQNPVLVSTQKPSSTTPATTTTPTGTTPATTTPATTTPSTTTPSTTTPSTTTPSTTSDTTLSTITSLISTLVQDGTQFVESLATQGSSLVQSIVSAVQSQQTTQTGTQSQDLQSLVTKKLQEAGLLPSTTTPADVPTGGSPETPAASVPTDSPVTLASALFPRSSVPTVDTPDTSAIHQAGLAPSATATGTTGSMGSPMHAASQGQEKEYTRPEYLSAAENLEAALGETPSAVIPVAEQ